MVLDNEEQRNMLLMIFNAVNIPASAIEKFLELKPSIINAKVLETTSQEQ